MIPRKFANYVREKLQDKVTLKGPSGTTTWEVGLTRRNDMLFLRDGWTEFVNAYSLEENDILIFKYNGNSCFSILIFDRESLCEKESSYFIKKCGHSRHGNKNQKGFLKDILEEFTQEYSHEEFELGRSKKTRMVKDRQNPISLEQVTSAIPQTSHVKATCIDVQTDKERPGDRQKSWSSELVKPLSGMMS